MLRDAIIFQSFRQYDTRHDASYYGVWVNLKELSVVSFVEGEIYVKLLNSAEEMKNELHDMKIFYSDYQPKINSDYESRIDSDYEKFFWGEDETDAEIELYKKFNEEDKK